MTPPPLRKLSLVMHSGTPCQRLRTSNGENRGLLRFLRQAESLLDVSALHSSRVVGAKVVWGFFVFIFLILKFLFSSA